MNKKDHPKFINEFIEKFKANISHAFVFHYNIGDYVDDESILPIYLSKLFVSADVVAFYDRSSGITFLTSEMEKKALETLELTNKSQGGTDFDKLVHNVTGETQEKIELPKDRLKAIPILLTLMRKLKTVVIFKFPESIIPSGTMGHLNESDRDCIVIFQTMAKDNLISEKESCLIVLARNLSDIHEDVRATFECIKVPLPDKDSRESFIKLKKTEKELKFDNPVPMFVNMSSGLSKFQIEDSFLRSKFQGGTVKLDFLKQRKNEIISSEYNDVLEVPEPRGGFEMVGGHEEVKEFLKDFVVEPMRAGKTHVVPMGVLLTGPPGTGKSILAEAVAKECGFNFVKLQPDKILNSLVGQSEKNLERALNLIDTMNPCVVFIDELDKSTFATADNSSTLDSGVSSNIARRLQEYMSDTKHRGKVLFLGATNYPNKLSPALKRPGRFDEKIPLLVPDVKDRAKIFEVILTKYFNQAGIKEDIDYLKLSGLTDGYTGAEIERICLKAVRLAKGNPVGQEELETAIAKIKKSTKDIQYMTILALMECDDEDLIPPKYREIYSKKEEELKKVEVERKRGEIEKTL